VIAGLKAKGKAKKDYSGFVIRLKEVAWELKQTTRN
jgi:hypothetical protein